MDGFIIKSTEGRLMLGITIFLATMILIGWIAINEPGRMASFELQQTGRAIERGGELFAANCAACHGAAGRGTGQGPALNSPHLFGYDFLADANSKIASAQREIVDLEALEEPTEENLGRIEELNSTLEGDDGLLAQRADLLGEMGLARLKGYLPGLTQLEADLEAGIITPLAFTQNLAIDANRLAQISWGGTIEGYIQTTLIHGRPGSNSVWPGDGMVSWSQRGGGPLRDDQINDIVAYITNWDKGDNWTLDDLNAVNQFALIHANAALISTTVSDSGDGGDNNLTGAAALGPEDCAAVDDCVSGFGNVAEIAAALPEGDAANGQTIYATMGCVGCHVGGAVGPDIVGTWARVEGERLAVQEGEWTAEEYVIAAIIYPNDFVPEGYFANVMPSTFGQQLTIEELGDVVAYIRSQ
jgi:mono/diheme cytochrome c family protein